MQQLKSKGTVPRLALEEQVMEDDASVEGYESLTAYGTVKINAERKDKHASQRHLIESLDPQWLPKFDALREEYVKQMLEGIVNFSIAVTRIDARWKLSQNRGRREMELIAAELEKSGDSGARALAALHRQHYVVK